MNGDICKQPDIDPDDYCETAMCAWECVVAGLGSKDIIDMYASRLRDECGTIDLRLSVVRDTWSVALTNSYENYVRKHQNAREYAGAYDWELVPVVIEMAIQSGESLYVQATWDAVVDQYFMNCGYTTHDNLQDLNTRCDISCH